MRAPLELTDAFRRRGLKVTPQRQCIFRIMVDADRHPTAEQVHERAVAEMPTISLRTVYQTLNDLAAMGEIRALDLGTGSARFDPNVDAHQHLVCTGCGMVRDVYADHPVPAPDVLADGFRVEATEIVFRGRCASCAPSPEG